MERRRVFAVIALVATVLWSAPGLATAGGPAKEETVTLAISGMT